MQTRIAGAMMFAQEHTLCNMTPVEN